MQASGDRKQSLWNWYETIKEGKKRQRKTCYLLCLGSRYSKRLPPQLKGIIIYPFCVVSPCRASINSLLWPWQADPHPCGWLSPRRPSPHRLGHWRGGPCGRIPERLWDGSGARPRPGGERDRQRQRQRHDGSRSRSRSRSGSGRERRGRSVVQPVWCDEVTGEPSGFSTQPQCHTQFQPSTAFLHHQHQPNKQRHQCQGGTAWSRPVDARSHVASWVYFNFHNKVQRPVLSLDTQGKTSPLFQILEHQAGSSFWMAGDPEELGGSSGWWRGVGTGSRTDALSPRPCPEDSRHAAHAVPLLWQVGASLTYKRGSKEPEQPTNHQRPFLTTVDRR